jgi:hypothetical protein
MRLAAKEGVVSMRKRISYRILAIGLRLGLGVAMCTGVARAQRAPAGLSEVNVYCSGMVTDQAVPSDTYLISGEDSSYRITFTPGDAVYINRGADQGVKVGDEFEVIRHVHDIMPVLWFKFQPKLSQAMGANYADIGRVRVVNVLPKTSVAEVGLSCDLLQRGDIVRPFQTRPFPTLHNVKFDPFAPPSGKKLAMVVTTKDYGVISGVGGIVYVNLGSAQGVQAGDYFRIFRYQGSSNDLLYQERNTAFKMYGFGSTPVAYQWDNLPRQVIGEGIVLRTGPNSSTVMVTNSRNEISVGDYVEIE